VKVLILGHKGMLGHMVHKYLSTKNNCELVTTDLRWPTEEFKEYIYDFDGDFIVNCIAAIPQRKNDFELNTTLPIWLDELDKSYKIIHPGTDGEMGDDEYGLSKKIATDHLVEKGKDTTIIKTSIVGPEINNKASLLEWFLNTKEKEIDGYDEFYWNGITTLQWSKISYKIMCDFYRYDTLNIPTSECISKYDLLNIMKSVFDKEIYIHRDSNTKVHRCLNRTYDMPHLDIETQLKELKEFYYES
jgi:dTDP-4-dehydrorhamnose reductase